MLALLALVMALALAVTKVVDLIRNGFDKSGNAPKWVWNVVAFVVGIVFAFGWEKDLTGAAFALVPALANSHVSDFLGRLLTGIVIGGGAGFWHEFLDALSGIAKRRSVNVG